MSEHIHVAEFGDTVVTEYASTPEGVTAANQAIDDIPADPDKWATLKAEDPRVRGGVIAAIDAAGFEYQVTMLDPDGRIRIVKRPRAVVTTKIPEVVKTYNERKKGDVIYSRGPIRNHPAGTPFQILAFKRQTGRRGYIVRVYGTTDTAGEWFDLARFQ